ncbi:MAG: cupredoxin domain-containing protein [Gaiellales bacterium]
MQLRANAATASVLLALAVAGVALAATPSLPVGARVHRLHVPPPPVAALPSALAVDEAEYTLRPSQIVLAAGQVKINVYNRGMDDHDLTLVDGNGVTQQVLVHPGDSATMIVALKPGSYRLYCSLFEGTPQSHDALGMHAIVQVK